MAGVCFLLKYVSKGYKLNNPSMLAIWPIMITAMINPTLIGFEETSRYLSVQLFSVFSLVTIPVENLPERTKTDLIIESDQTVWAVIAAIAGLMFQCRA